MGNIFVTSDLHFCHNQPFLYEKRGYKSIEEMNKDLIAKFNSRVSAEDKVYILGDIMLNDNTEGIKCLRQLNGNIEIIIGNHDTDNRLLEYTNDGYYDNEGFSCVFAKRFNYNKYHFFLSHYPTITGNFDENESLHKQTINLCGHLHIDNAFVDWKKYNAPIYHCEVDAHNGYPISLDEIIAAIKEFHTSSK